MGFQYLIFNMNAILFSIIVGLSFVEFRLSSRLLADKNHNLQGMLIFINDEVPEGDGSLLKNIEDYVNEASKALWTATGNMDSSKPGVKLDFVYVRLPMTWKAKTYGTLTWQNCYNADILITNSRDNNYQPEPFTKQTGKCGEPGDYTRYPYDFFKTITKDQKSKKGRIMMNEFIKLRYGVFSEKPFQNILTVFNGQEFVPSTCGSNIKWSLSKPAAYCSTNNNDCQYAIDPGQNHVYSAMFDEESKSSEFFCNNSTNIHNSMARSLHNIKCGQRSISDVILGHPDFKLNDAKTNFNSVRFIEVKGSNRKIVLVIDSSGSMLDYGRMDNVKNAASEFIANVVEDSAEVGIVSFNDSGTIVSLPLAMNNPDNRHALINAISSLVPNGNTNIPDALRTAVKALGGDVNSVDTTTGTIILLTDGENNMEIFTWGRFIVIMLSSKGVIVHTISYGSDADKQLFNLSSATGGRHLYADPFASYPDLMNKFAVKAFCDIVNNSPIKIFQTTETIVLKTKETLIPLVNVDPFIGTNLYVTATFSADTSQYNITMVGPDKSEYLNTKSIKQKSSTTLTFKLSQKPPIGNYRLKLKNLSQSVRFKRSLNTMVMTAVMFSTPDPLSTRIVKPSGKISKSEITEVDSYTSMQIMTDLSTCRITAGEKASVILMITNPNNTVTERQMYDNGLGEDSIEGDEIFTASLYPNDLTLKGYYTFQSKVAIVDSYGKNSIQRTVDFDALLVKSISSTPITDKIPPARIENINITNVDGMNKTLTISFLATGDDGLVGNISQYEINIINPKTTTIKKKAESESLKPLSINLNLKSITSDAPFQIFVRGVDPNGNAADWSPQLIYSWDYDTIWEKYSKHGIQHQINFRIICMGIFLIEHYINNV